jgi:hypothetical protein
MKNCEKSYKLVCNLLSSGANFGTGKQKDIMLDKKKIKELIRQGALNAKDGDQLEEQFSIDQEEEEEKEEE